MRWVWAYVIFAMVLGAMETEPHALQYGRLPLVFEPENTEAGTVFLTRARGFAAIIEAGGTLQLIAGKEPDATSGRISLAGGNTAAQARGERPLPGRVNYLVGSDPRKWRTGIPTYAAVLCRSVYPGVDLIYYGNEGELEYDFIVAPGTSHESIRLRFEGAADLRVEPEGDVVVVMGSTRVRQHRPIVYQPAHGSRRPLQARYVLNGGNELAVEVEGRDPTLPLIIDPVLSYATYAGGSSDDRVYGIQTDASGCTYVAGETWSSTLPGSTRGYKGGRDAFITKLNAAGNAVLYTTFLGGTGRDGARGLAVDGAGNVYVAGVTASADFPATVGAFRSTLHGAEDGFAAKLNATGAVLTYATYLGGTANDIVTGIALASSGEVALSGYTSSMDFPTSAGAAQRTYGGGSADAFLARLDNSGTRLTYSSYLGGGGIDTANAVALDPLGNAYLAGQTDSADFPVRNAVRPQGGPPDAFISKFDQAGGLAYSTFLGGRGVDVANAIAVDPLGAAYVAGYTSSQDFPTTSVAYQRQNRGGYDAFAAKLTPGGSALEYVTYVGGSGQEEARAIALDAAGRVYLSGWTSSADFPLMESPQPSFQGERDAFATCLDAGGAALNFSALIGGGSEDVGQAVAVDSAGAVYVGGYTLSSNFPVMSGAIQSQLPAGVNGFVLKLSRSQIVPLAISPSSGTGLNQVFTATVSVPGGIDTLAGVWILINTAFTNEGACSLSYDRTSNSVSLLAAPGVWNVAGIGGSGIKLESDRCALNMANAAASFDKGMLTLSADITFKTSFAGPKKIYVYARNTAGGFSSVQELGSWTVLDPRPAGLAISPSSGTAAAQAFTVAVTVPGGPANLAGVWLVVNGAFTNAGACSVAYQRAANSVSLFIEPSGTYTGAAPGAIATVENDRCVLNAGASSVSWAGETISVKFDLTFKPGFAGTKNLYVYAQTITGTFSEVVKAGSWAIPAAAPSLAPLSISPSSGRATTGVLTLSFSSPGGLGSVNTVWLLINSAFTATGSCFVAYDRVSNSVQLHVEASGTWSSAITGGAAILENDRCAVRAADSSVSFAGGILTVRFGITFKPAFAGAKFLYIFSRDRTGGFSNVLQAGSWSIPDAAPVTPVSISPPSGYGTSQVFTAALSTPGGPESLTGLWLLINTGFTGTGACSVMYHRSSNSVFLYSETARVWHGAAVGAADLIENEYCTLAAASSSASFAAGTATIRFSIAFKPVFAGQKNLYLYAQSTTGNYSDVLNAGSWFVPTAR